MAETRVGRGRPPKERKQSELKAKFRKEVQDAVKQKCNEINHYVAGCNSPFSYLQIADTQEKLVEIFEILGIKEDEQ